MHDINYKLTGPPSAVVNLTAVQQDQCSILIKWNPPYLLPGLNVLYKVYSNERIIEEKVRSTTYVYYPALINATYDVKIEAFNNTVIGYNASISMEYHIGK